jgi:hypothetical protein
MLQKIFVCTIQCFFIITTSVCYAIVIKPIAIPSPVDAGSVKWEIIEPGRENVQLVLNTIGMEISKEQIKDKEIELKIKGMRFDKTIIVSKWDNNDDTFFNTYSLSSILGEAKVYAKCTHNNIVTNFKFDGVKEMYAFDNIPPMLTCKAGEGVAVMFVSPLLLNDNSNRYIYHGLLYIEDKNEKINDKITSEKLVVKELPKVYEPKMLNYDGESADQIKGMNTFFDKIYGGGSSN